MTEPKILFLDIETAPNTAYVWGLFDQNISINQLVETSRVLCWAAKWQGSDQMMWRNEKDPHMLDHVHDLLDEADAVVHYNGARFDIPNLNKSFLLNNMAPPQPFKQIDLLRTVRRQFKFTSNKLDHVCKELGLGSKAKHEGFELWIKCMEGDPKAWERMQEYNMQDVVILERLYDRLLPWVHGGINQGNFTDAAVCSKCGSDDLQKRGFITTGTGSYQQYSCNDCGAWSREKKATVLSVLREG
jgi:uncharacterized protein YprB with RNaseH-like and TPR domain